MVLHSLGRKVGFGTGISFSGWHQNVFRILPLIIGVAALATTLLLGSYLWGLATRRKNKKEGETPAPLPDFHPHPPADYKPSSVLSFREFIQEGTGRKNKERETPTSLKDFLSRPDYRPDRTLSFQDFHAHTHYEPNTIDSFGGFNEAPPSFSPKVTGYDIKAYFEELDAQEDYAEVLAEAKSNASDATQIRPPFNSPEKYHSVQSWLARSPDIRRHTVVSLEDAEAVFARHQADIFHSHEHKPSWSWKRLLFWKRLKRSDTFEFNLNGGAIHSTCTTPMHQIFKSSRTRATVAPSTAAITPSRNFTNSMPKRANSGPVYYDATPYTPNRSSWPFSGPLSACATPSRDGLYEPTYIPLKRPYSNFKTCASPLYVP